jgi:hypothetical protein
VAFTAPGPFDLAANVPGWARAAGFTALLLAGAGFVRLVAARFGGGHPGWMLAALGTYLVFFAIMGGIVAMLVSLVADAPAMLAAGGGVAAWMAGFATPGAPAGIGTREAAMVLFVGHVVPQGALIVSAALFRIVTLAGDVVCFALGWLLCRAGEGAARASHS